MDKETLKIIEREDWTVKSIDGQEFIEAYGKYFNPAAHPLSIYGKLFREETNPELKFIFMKKMHDMLWPQDIPTWHYWTEDRFRTYCEGWRIISWASGASGGKSVDAAKIGLIEWIAAPKTTAVVIASTTLTSLKHRIYGYILSYIRETGVKVPFVLMRSQPPQVLFNRDDEIHCISAMAAAKGTDQDAIKNYIGRHPKGKFVLLLDEAPDLDPIILEALPNLEAGKTGAFQCLVIGNSSSKFDLHGALSTPKDGWENINPEINKKWETVQPGGICQFFSCYDSPAIHEKDGVKRKLLGKFLITEETLKEKEKAYGKNSEAFCRFVLGYWKASGAESNLVVNKDFLSLYQINQKAEFSGLKPLVVCGGLDAAFSTGGDKCLLQLGVLGQDVNGNIVLDFRGDDLTFEIKLRVNTHTPIEVQIVNQLSEILQEFGCNLGNVAFDATGQGRALGELARLSMQALVPPLKIWSTRLKNPKASETPKNANDIIVKTSLELWTDVADFIPTNQLRGMSGIVIQQLTTRQKKATKGQKEVLESKIEYKQRMGAISPTLAHSPDEADGVALCVQAAKIRFGFHPGQKVKIAETEDPSLKKYLLMKKEQEEAARKVREERRPPLATFGSDINPNYSSMILKPFVS